MIQRLTLFSWAVLLVLTGWLVGCSTSPAPSTPAADVLGLIEEGRAAIDSGNLSFAIETLKEAVRADPNSVEAHFLLGNAYAQDQQYSQAEEHLKRALDLDPNHADAQSNLGVVHYNQRKLDAAEDAFRSALELTPNDAEIHYNLGGVLAAMNNLQAAEEEFLTAKDLDANLAQVYLGLGSVYKLQGRNNEAIAALREYLNRSSDPQWRQTAEQMLTELESTR